MRITRLIGLALAGAFIMTANVNCLMCGGCGSDLAEKIAEEAIEEAIEKGSGGKVDIDVGDKGVSLEGLPGFAKYPGAEGKGKWYPKG